MSTHRYAFLEEFCSKNPDFDSEALIDCFDIHRMERMILGLVDRYLSRWRVTASTLWVLINLLSKEDNAMSPSQLALATGLSPASMTAALDALEKKGYVQRGSHPTDRRMVSVHVTAEGRSFMDESFHQHGRGGVRMLKHLSQEERKTFLRLYEKVLIGAQELLEEPT